MLVSFNMSREVFEYFKDFDLSDIANTLLEQYDFTALPPTSGRRDVERKVNITNPAYIALYNTLGPRSKKVSLGRLFEFAYNLDVLSLPYFKIKPTRHEDNPAYTLIDRAYRALIEAQKYVDDEVLKDLTRITYQYKEKVKNGTETKV